MFIFAAKHDLFFVLIALADPLGLSFFQNNLPLLKIRKTMLWSWLVIAGAVHGMLLAFYLWFARKEHSITYRYLGSSIFVYSVYLIFGELVREHPQQYPHLIALAFPLVFLIGPLLYFFAKAAKEGGRSSKLVVVLHLLPTALCVLYLLPFFLQSGSAKIYFLENARKNGMPLDMMMLWLIGCAHVLLYMLLVVYNIRQYQKHLKNKYSNIDEMNLQWLILVSISNGFIWGLYALLYILYILNITIDPLGIPDVFFSLMMAILIFFIGFMVFQRTILFANEKEAPFIKKYSKSGLQKIEMERLAEELQVYMHQEKPYKNADLSLKILSEHLNLSPQHLSQILNEQFGKNFYDFINEYRVKEVIKLMECKDLEHYTLLGLAYEAGFKSKSTFNSIFKKITDSTPSDFRSKMQRF